METLEQEVLTTEKEQWITPEVKSLDINSTETGFLVRPQETSYAHS